jgi:lysozyme
VTEKLLEMLKRHEGVEHHIYRCSAGFWTLGAGRNVDPQGGLGLSGDEVDYLLENDIDALLRNFLRNIRGLRTLMMCEKML